MGDMGDVFRDMTAYKKEKRASRIANTDDKGWSKHTEYHWYRVINGKKINYWPSNGLCMIGKKKHNINGKFMRNLLLEANNG
jgi:hypothetical protein